MVLLRTSTGTCVPRALRWPLPQQQVDDTNRPRVARGDMAGAQNHDRRQRAEPVAEDHLVAYTKTGRRSSSATVPGRSAGLTERSDHGGKQRSRRQAVQSDLAAPCPWSLTRLLAVYSVIETTRFTERTKLADLKQTRKEELMRSENSVGLPKGYTRRHALKVGGVSVVGLYLAGCGGSETAGGTGVSVTYDFTYAGTPGGMGKYWRGLRSRLKEQDVGASISDLSEVDFENLLARLQANHSAKSGPTLETWFQGYNTFQFVEQGALEPLNDYVSDSDSWLFTSGSNYNGERYCAPILPSNIVLIANRDVIEKAGVDVGESFGSWQEFRDTCGSLRRRGVTPISLGAGDGFGVEAWIVATGKEFMDSLADIPQFQLGERPVDDPVVSAWVDRLYEMKTDGLINRDARDITTAQAFERFGRGEAAFILGDASIVEPKASTDIVGLWPGEGSMSEPPIVATGSGLIMTSYGDNKEAAGKLTDFMMEQAQLDLWVESTGALPCNREYDPSSLDPFRLRLWELFQSEPEPFWWEENVTPGHVDFFLQTAPQIAGDVSPDQMRAKYSAAMEQLREKPETKVLAKYVDVLG